MIAMTATLPNMYLAPLCQLLIIPLFHAGSILRGLRSDFEQCEIEMWTCICLAKGQFVSKGLTLLAEFIQDNPSSSAVLIVIPDANHSIFGIILSGN